jgi:hypothetical protein
VIAAVPLAGDVENVSPIVLSEPPPDGNEMRDASAPSLPPPRSRSIQHRDYTLPNRDSAQSQPVFRVPSIFEM